MDLHLQNAHIVTMDSDRRVIDGDIYVADGEILAVGEVPKELFARDVPRRTFDCQHRVVIPGLVQAHTHLCQTLFRNRAEGLELLDWLRERIWPFEGAHTPETLGASARLGLAELIRGGTTACLDMGTVKHTDVIFEAARDAGFRLTGGKAMMDVTRGVPGGLRESTADSLAESERLIETWHGAEDGRLNYAYAPRFVLSCTEKLMESVAEKARDLGVRIHTHASENQHELESVRERFGLDNVSYLDSIGISGEDVILAHCVWLTAREMRLMSDKGTHLCHCPSSNLKLASGVAKIPELDRMGVPLALGADGAPCNNNLDMWMEMRLAALIHLPRVGPAGFAPQRVFEMATLGGAAALGQLDRIGSIETGKRGDLVVVDLEAPHAVPAGEDIYARLVYDGKASDVRAVFIDGQVVLDEGVLTTLDEDEVLAEATERASEIAALIA